MKNKTFEKFSLMIDILAVLTLVLVSGCNETQKASTPNIKPLNQQLAPAPQDWKDAYGDTMETQIVFNTFISRRNEILIADIMNRMHPSDVNDPNNLKARIDNLEAFGVKYTDVVRFGNWDDPLSYWGYSCGKIRKIDPNNLKARIEKLEAVDPNIEKLRVYKDADSVYGWRLDTNNKINEIIDRINGFTGIGKTL